MYKPTQQPMQPLKQECEYIRGSKGYRFAWKRTSNPCQNLFNKVPKGHRLSVGNKVTLTTHYRPFEELIGSKKMGVRGILYVCIVDNVLSVTDYMVQLSVSRFSDQL
eukprot:GILK01014210.1.p1 GENE.GILK01014210.1~~GILK01014210.1.p1  ORF type:complete len:107 (-),score=1.28 GILK01014210.1:564-884(-)